MRLFIAILLEDSVKNALKKSIAQLKQRAVQGNFTRDENLHLTLEFLGETTQLNAAKKAMKQVIAEPFSIQLGQFGKFFRKEGDIYWRGLKACSSLEELQKNLHILLEQEGFSLEKRQFIPHLTLGRNVICNCELEDISDFPAEMTVKKISLMQSQRINGKLVYTELFSKFLTD